MKRAIFRGFGRSLGLLLVMAAGDATVWSAEPGIIVKILLRTTLSADESKETIIASAEFPPGGTTGRHTHPGDEYATVLAGALEILVDGQPPKQVNAGEAYHNARGVVHETKNAGEGTARVVSTFVVDRGQPIMKPVGTNSTGDPDRNANSEASRARVSRVAQ